MRLQIEPGERVAEVNGVPCRVWYGVSPEGGRCLVFVASIAIPELPGVLDEEKQRALEAGLREAGLFEPPMPPGLS